MKEIKTDGSIEEVAHIYPLLAGLDAHFDSRRIAEPECSMFLALSGQRTDGHRFVEELSRLGVAALLLREGAEYRVVEEYRGTVVVSPDPLQLFQRLAAHHRTHFDIPIVGITGSNGKTIVKDWLRHLLSPSLRVCATPRSYNGMLGLPYSVWRLDGDDEVGVFEVGISEPGEMELLAEILRPTVGVFTHLGVAHLANFRDRDHLLQEKMKLFRDCPTLFQPENVPFYPGTDLPSPYRSNLALCLAVARHFGRTPEELEKEATRLPLLKNRLEQRASRDGGLLINDSYSNDVEALTAALDFAVQQNPYDRLVLILGEIQKLSGSRWQLSRLLRERVDEIICVGDVPTIGLEGLKRTNFGDTEALLDRIGSLSFPKATLLIKGAHYQRLDRVADALSHHSHPTRLVIDLEEIDRRMSRYRRRLPRGTKILGVVKASAYGSGSVAVARRLAARGVDYLGVAYVDEGTQLREAGVTTPILVMNPDGSDPTQMVSYGLEPVVHETAALKRYAAAHLPFHLEFDTGMARLGFRVEEAADLAARLGDKAVLVKSIMSHLAAADAPEHDDFTRRQFERFELAFEKFRATSGHAPLRQLLNSAGAVRFPEHAYEMVRLGIGLYGTGADGALSLTTRIAAVHELPPGASVGYGRQGQAGDQSLTVATLSIGYADGLPRIAGNGRYSVLVGDRLAPIVGSVCMDMTMVDVTGNPDAFVGAEVTIFGPALPLDKLAEAAGTIPYEILTGIGERVRRVYVG